MDGIPFIPALFVLTVVLGHRYVIRRKRLGIYGWFVTGAAVLFLSMALPLVWGVWLPDVFGQEHTLCSASTSKGDQIRIVQYWNHVDFYTTEARVTAPDGVTRITVLDGDASKSWGASLELDPSQTGATFRLIDGRIGRITW